MIAMPDKVKYAKNKAHQRYKLADGTPVPGVTTVLGILDKPALLSWAWQCGVDGIDYRKARDQAADAGTLAHWWIECHLRGLEPDLSDFAPNIVSQAENAVLKFMDWWEHGGFNSSKSEQQLVSERCRFGGTLDIVAERDGRAVLVDLKTSKAIYPEYWRQVAAYGRLWSESAAQPVSAYIICRIGKGDSAGDWEVHERTDVNGPWRVFEAALATWWAIKGEGSR